MKSLIDDLVEETGLRPEILRVAVTRTMAHLHRGFHERCGPSGDYVGGSLSIDLGFEGHLHFLGMVYCLVQDYGLEEEARWFMEYGDRIVPREIHEAIFLKMDSWKKREPR